MAALYDCTTLRKEQALLFLNRRGYAPALLCHSCGWVAGCDHCDARLTVHLRQRQLRCHHCAARRALPPACPACGGQLLTRGLGTEQIEDYLSSELRLSGAPHRQRFHARPGGGADPLRAGQRRGALRPAGHADAYQGPPLPGRAAGRGDRRRPAAVTAPIFAARNASHSCWCRYPGRAGRERRGGQVLVQTHHPEHPLLQALMARRLRGGDLHR
jgi:primosomal protein N' (replication factor Y)